MEKDTALCTWRILACLLDKTSCLLPRVGSLVHVLQPGDAAAQKGNPSLPLKGHGTRAAHIAYNELAVHIWGRWRMLFNLPASP